jgi:integrase/recombinase XerC
VKLDIMVIPYVPYPTMNAIAWCESPLASPAVAGLLSAFLSGRCERTLLAYHQDLEDFARFVDVAGAQAAAELLLQSGPGAANRLAVSYRADLVASGLAAATVNRRLAALRSMVKLARTFGVVSWALEVPNVKAQPYRDTRGPGRGGFRRLLDELEQSSARAKVARDRALLHLLYDLALRRNEAVSLDLEHLDLDAATVSVLGKGRTERVALTLPEPTLCALRAWLELRGTEPGPLFLNMDRACKGGRLTGRSVARVVGELGRSIGIRVRPHGLRHAAITEALDLTRGDVRAVQKFSRHHDLRTLTVYDDNRRDLAGEVAKLVAGVV